MPGFLRRFLVGLKDGRGLDRRHVFVYGGILLALEIAAFVFMVAGTHGLIVPLGKPTTTDFVSFYSAGALADAGTPALAYDRAAHDKAEEAATEPGITYVHFYYPPVYLILCAAMAWLPYLAAFTVFTTATLVLFLWAACCILEQYDGPALLALCAFPAVLWTIGIGQNALLTAALFGAATLLVDRRPVLSGLLFGAICYKPHLGLLIPVALAAGGHRRAFAAALASVAALVLLSIGLFGWHTWQSFFIEFARAPAVYHSGTVDHDAYVNLYGAVLVLGGSLAEAYAAQILAMLAAGAVVAVVWHARLSLPTRAATLIAATIVMAPIILFYDLMLAAIAAAWLIRAGRQNGFYPWEQPILIGLFGVPAVTRIVARFWHAPIGALAALVFLALVGARAWQEAAGRGAGEGVARARQIPTGGTLAGAPR